MMKKLSILLALAGVVLGTFAAAPAAYAHATFNVGGYGDISLTGGVAGANGGTTGGGVSGSNYASGTASGTGPVWANGSAAPTIPGSTTVPYIGYLGLHNAKTVRVIQTGTYANPTGGVLGDSLLGQVWRVNQRATAQYVGGPSAANPLPTDLSLAVAANSFNSFSSSTSFASGNSTGVDVGAIHVSTGAGNVEQNIINLGLGSPVYLNVVLEGDNGLNDQQLAFSLYHGWAQAGSDDLSGLTLLTTQTMATAGGQAYYAYQLTGAADSYGNFGEYTVVVGAVGSVGGQYRMTLESSTNPVPIPAAVWLFGSALLGVFGIGRRKDSVA